MRKIENECVGCDVCYNCGRKESEHLYCDICGEEIDDDYYQRGKDICEKCMFESEEVNELITLDNVLLFGANDRQPVRLNHALYMIFDDDEIEEVLKRELESMPPEKLRAKLEWYVKESTSTDLKEFVEFLDVAGIEGAKDIVESEVKYG